MIRWVRNAGRAQPGSSVGLPWASSQHGGPRVVRILPQPRLLRGTEVEAAHLLRSTLEEEMGKATSSVFCRSKAVTEASQESRGGEVDPQIFMGGEAKPHPQISQFSVTPLSAHCSGTWSAFGDYLRIQTSVTGV